MTDQSYRWVIVGYTIVLQAVSVGAIIYTFSLFAGPWIEAFGASRAEVMLTISLLQISFGLASPFVGSAMDRLRMRNIVLFGAACYATGWLLVSQVAALWQLYGVFMLVFPMAMTTMGTLAAQTLVTRWFVNQRGLAIGISAMGTNVGGVLLPLLVAPFLAAGAWRDVAFALMLGGIVLVVPLTWFVLARRSPYAEPGGTSATSVSAATVLRTRTFWITASAMLPLNLAFGAVQFNLGVFAADLGFADRAGLLIALCSSCMIAGKFLFGALGDWLDHRRLYWIAATAQLAALLLLQNQPGWTTLLAGVVFAGIAGGSLLPVMGLIIGARFELAVFGRAMGLIMLTLSIASLGPMLAGWIYDTTGSYDGAFMLLAGLILPGAVAMVALPPPRPAS